MRDPPGPAVLALEVLGEKPEDQSLETLEELWQVAKRAERNG